MPASNLENPLPSMGIAVTEACNPRCDYCPTDGDSVEMQAERLHTGEYVTILSAAVDVGFANVSFTGGEPLLSNATAERTFVLAGVMRELRATKGLEGYTKLNTNGARLLKYRHDIVDAGFDALNPRTFTALTKRNGGIFDETTAGILMLKKTYP